jgi:pyruvate/2-oxoglutarate dehydrogenase complex dihydrolipoamide dehydrogenase (E3) component
LGFCKGEHGLGVLEHVAANDASGESKEELEFDLVVLALGRKARKGFGMEELGIELRGNGTVEANGWMQTNIPNIYVVGDATGPLQFTHVASHQAWYAAVNALLAPFWKFKADYRVIPWVTYTNPQVARVGISEADAKKEGIAYEKSVYHLDDLDRAIAEDKAYGFVKVLTVPGKDTILGVTIVGAYGGELLAEWTLAMRHGLGLKKILATVHPYPTWSESAKYAAGVWAQNHKPLRLISWGTRYFKWLRG